jgi:hypothetical protein
MGTRQSRGSIEQSGASIILRERPDKLFMSMLAAKSYNQTNNMEDVR